MELGEYEVARKPESLMALVKSRADEIVDGSRSQIPLPFNHVRDLSGEGLRRGCTTVLAGPPGNGKTYMALQLCKTAQEAGLEWLYWPMEDEAVDYFERYMALYANDWSMTGGTSQSAMRRVEYISQGGIPARDLSLAAPRFLENPYLPYSDSEKRYFKPKPLWSDVLEFILGVADKVDFICIDPLSGIRFKDKNANFWDLQEEFMCDLSNCIKGRRAHVLLVAHTSKLKQYGKEPANLTMDNIQGAAAFQRFAQYIYLLDFHHDPRESDVKQHMGVKNVMHKRTLYIGKTRYAKGAGKRVAMDFSRQGPTFEEHGIIC